MPPKKAAAEKSAAAPKAEEALNPEAKLMWAVICHLSKEGKFTSIDWEDVKGPIEASTGHAARQRWDALKKRMQARGSELPSARAPGEVKAKVTKAKVPKTPTPKKPRGKKAKEAAEAAANEEAQGSGGEGEEAQEASGEDAAENESS